ncbi:MAG: hypothetical protein IPO88_20350 [Nannocystis sp.]|uniref:hypothetical protein n=1 Tax=Nannocystis sp. TaxID=1962667 RepID=UPI002426385A|nr:hypothetical protein [Nannocystis sp.]MBK9755811.1 hypothetical protein [Nannocystis sp.]
MASFSTTHPFAYHAFPLTAARSIWTTAALLGKDDQGSAVHPRWTGADTDRRLGFSRYVHLYLPRRGTTPGALPILAAQLQPARDPACPHALLVVPTDNLADPDCSLCNWNIAVSRPGVPGVAKGGNWTRGTNPERIAEVWRAFRARSPDPVKARGFWSDPEVPILTGDQIAANLRLLSRAPQKTPELLLRSPARVFAGATLLAFSRADLASLQLLGPPPDGATLSLGRVPGLRPRRRPARPAPPAPRRLPRRTPPRPPEHRFRRHPPQTAGFVKGQQIRLQKGHPLRPVLPPPRRGLAPGSPILHRRHPWYSGPRRENS